MKSKPRKSSRHLITSQDLIYEILLRLPAPSLMRFKRTCKHWNSIISVDPMFAELHTKTCTQKLTLLFQTQADPDSWDLPQSNPDFLIYKLPESKIETRILQGLTFRRLDLVGSSGQVLLFFLKDDASTVPTFVVYDCVNGKRMKLAGLPRDGNLLWEEFLVYDATKNIHKVLVYSSDPNAVTGTDCCYITGFSTKVLTRNDGWRKKPSPFRKHKSPLCHTAINGVLYWLAFGVGLKDGAVSVKKDIYRTFIQPFDIAKEKFLNTINCPHEHFRYESEFHTFHWLQLRGCLGLMCVAEFDLHIWVLKDSSNSSWIQLHNIRLRTIFDMPIPSIFKLQPVFVVERLNRLPSILLSHENKHYWYEMDGKKAKEIDFKDPSIYGRFLTAWFY